MVIFYIDRICGRLICIVIMVLIKIWSFLFHNFLSFYYGCFPYVLEEKWQQLKVFFFFLILLSVMAWSQLCNYLPLVSQHVLKTLEDFYSEHSISPVSFWHKSLIPSPISIYKKMYFCSTTIYFVFVFTCTSSISKKHLSLLCICHIFEYSII